MTTNRPSFPARLPSGMPQTGAMPVGAKQIVVSAAVQSITPKKIALRADSMPATGQKSLKNTVKHQLLTVARGTGMDSAAVRTRMVKLLADGGISDQAVLHAMNAIERHRFVDSALAPQAYEDTSLPIGLSQTISKPNVVARMIALLRENASLDSHGRMGRVLEIGGGCGYQAAVLSLLCKEVYSIERLRGLYEKAVVNIRHLSAPNLHLLLGDGMLGAPSGAPYAGIIAAAGGEAIPQAWLDQLAIGGRIVAPIHTPGASNNSRGASQSLMVIDKTAQGLKQSVLEGVYFVPLKSGLA